MSGGGSTDDTLLGGRVALRQPTNGYRAAIDPVLLAAAVPARDGQTVLDAGSGSGAAALCLAWRVAGCRVTGIERQHALVLLATDNAARNDMADRLRFVVGDIAAPSDTLPQAGFDHVMTNPPYLDPARSRPPAHAERAAAHMEVTAPLSTWLAYCLSMVRPKGTVTMIHRADRVDAVLAGLHGRAGEAVVFPLWPRAGQPAKRVIVRARPGVAGPARIAPGLVLHNDDGTFTETAASVLTEGAALTL